MYSRIFAYYVRMRKLIPLFVIALVGVILTLAGCHASRSGYKSAPYAVVRSDRNFELRDYPALSVVETPMIDGGSGGSFDRLFRFITGGNVARQKIAMTTPVLMSGSGSGNTMAFVMPAGIQNVPHPDDASVTPRTLPAGRFAVMRFSGNRDSQREKEHLDCLRAWVAANGYHVSAPPVYAYFDPPWTPSFLRRNEVMLRVDQ